MEREELPEVMTIKEVQQFLKIGRNIRICRADFLRWFDGI